MGSVTSFHNLYDFGLNYSLMSIIEGLLPCFEIVSTMSVYLYDILLLIFDLNMALPVLFCLIVLC